MSLKDFRIAKCPFTNHTASRISACGKTRGPFLPKQEWSGILRQSAFPLSPKKSFLSSIRPCHPQVKHRCLYNGGCRLYGDGIAAGLHRFTLLYEIFF